MVKVIGIGEYAISNNLQESIKTYALGSCVALTVYDPVRQAAGMAHIVLPSFQPSNVIDKTRLCYYASTAVPFLLKEMSRNFGCLKGNLIIELYGGANSIKSRDVFKIGQRNVASIKGILSELNLSCGARDTGGKCSRTVEISVATGKTDVVARPIII